MATSTHLWASTQGVKSFTKDWSANGIRFSMVVEGDRAVLDSLAELVHSGQYTSLQDVANYCGATEVAKLIDKGVRPRTPQLAYSGQGLIAQLTIGGFAGLAEGNSTIGYPAPSATNVPGSSSCRIVFEPNDVDLKYGLPFRAGKRWDLEKTCKDVGILQSDLPAGMSDFVVEKQSLLALCNLFESNSWNSTIEKYQAIEFMQKNTNMNEWLKRHLRGQSNYRTWIPTVTVHTQYRTMPSANIAKSDVLTPGKLCLPNGPGNYAQNNWVVQSDGTRKLNILQISCEQGPPPWTQAPQKDCYGNIYVYLRGASQLEFNGDGWSIETQYNGFLEYDADLYEDPSKPPTP
jgi:hypothetical protein